MHRFVRRILTSCSFLTEILNLQVEVLKITAPPDALNALTIGPIFQPFTQLEELHITRSNVPAVGKHSFWGVPSLKILNLSQNNISHIAEHNFRGLVHLVELYLDDNRIESMPSETFRYLPELRRLSLARNRIHELVPRLFLMLGKLHSLTLSGNPLSELNPEVFKDVQALRTFQCRACQLTNVNTLIYRLLSDLMFLDLGENEFKYIAADEFHELRKLQVLLIDGNQLPVILDRTFGSSDARTGKVVLGDLQVLNLARNRLAKVTNSAFVNMSTLKDLDLSYNKLDKLETATFHPLGESLQTLNLSGNPVAMGDLKHILQMVSRVRNLALADMGLSELPLGLFAYHDSLRFLNLSGNSFSQMIPQILSPIPKLHTLDLSRNRFRGIDEKLLMRLEKVPNLVIKDNPWACDLCHIPPLLNRLNKTTMIEAMWELTCKSPYGLAARTLRSLQRVELRWCANGHHQSEDENTSAVGVPRSLLPTEAQLGLIAGLVAAILFIFVGVVVGVCVICSRHHANHYYTREEERNQETEAIFDSQNANIENGKSFKFPLDLTKAKKVSIATIDEITKDPELHVLTNGT